MKNMKVEVLVATINQTDLSLFYKMNIQTDVIICNQCDKNEFVEEYINGCRVRMLSTKTKGVGINRNLAMLLSDADICLCSDDDVTYIDGYEQIILNEFEKLNYPSVIGFSMTTTGDRKVDLMYKKTKKLSKLKGSIGGARLAFLRQDIMINNITFTTLFGGGSMYGSGEDSLFCRDVSKNKLDIYVTEAIVGNVHFEGSSWYAGVNEKFCFDKGAWCKVAYPKMWRILKYYLILKDYRQSDLKLIRVVKLFNAGAKAYKTALSYSDYVENK